MIPQCDPHASYLSHKSEIDSAVRQVLDSGWYILGQQVSQFESEFADFIGCRHAVGVANGTDAIELALRVSNIGHGDSVITPSHTATATVAAITRSGATPVFVDINPCTYTLDAEQISEYLSSNTKSVKAIIAVHLYGQPADMQAIMNISRQHQLIAIEDCAQAHGAAIRNRNVGSIADFGCFSFYPTKNLGALGDGGAVTTNDEAVAEKLREYREYGWKQRFFSDHKGINSRLDELQAAILRIKLKHMHADNTRRQQIAQRYTKGLSVSDYVLPTAGEDSTHVYHQYVIQTDQRDALMENLERNLIRTAIHYPFPVHKQTAYNNQDWQPLALTHSEHISRRILSLPMYPELEDKDVDTVVDRLLNFKQ